MSRFPMNYPTLLKRHLRRGNRVITSFDGLRQMEVDISKNVKLRTPHGLKVVARRRAANKVARAARKRNRS